MNFIMDEQSYADLNIFPTQHNTFSLFEMFKKTKTIGGREKMEALMKSPSNDLSYLTQRRDSIEFFKQSKIELKIDNSQFDLLLHYLHHDKGRLRSNLLDAFAAYFSDKIRSNQNYYIVKIGLKFLMKLLSHSAELGPILTQDHSPSYLKKLGNQINELLDQKDIKYVLTLSTYKKLRFNQLAKLDSIIRQKYKLEILFLLAIFYELDVFETLAKVSTDKKFCLPTYIEDKEQINLQAKGLFHPAISKPIANDILINDKNHLIFLSGSNMAGKSSLLKSIGTAIYLAHIGFPVPAKQFNTIVFNGLITTINLADSTQSGLSHYFSEVMRVKKIVQLLSERKKMFIIMDELFRGTNAKDAFDASELVISGFSEVQSSIFIVSSHITELVHQFKNKNVSFMQLEHLMVNEQPHFTYLLKEGVSKDGIGMYFIKKEKIASLLDQAKSLNTTS